MTEEERKLLCRWLRDPSVYDIGDKCSEAAEEIEQLVEEIAKAQEEIAFWRAHEIEWLKKKEEENERLATMIAETIASSDRVCDSYASENQRLSDEIERLTIQNKRLKRVVLVREQRR